VMDIGTKVRINMPDDEWLDGEEGEVIDIIDTYVEEDDPTLYLVRIGDGEEIFDETELMEVA